MENTRNRKFHFVYSGVNHTFINSMRSRRFQKRKRSERNQEGVPKKKNTYAKEILPTPPPSRSSPTHFFPIFCSPQGCSFARPLFRSLVRSPPGKRNETAATQANPSISKQSAKAEILEFQFFCVQLKKKDKNKLIRLTISNVFQ